MRASNQEELRATLPNGQSKSPQWNLHVMHGTQSTLTSHNVAFNGDHHMCVVFYTTQQN